MSSNNYSNDICTISAVIIINKLLKLFHSKVGAMGREERDQLIEVGTIYMTLFVVLYVHYIIHPVQCR